MRDPMALLAPANRAALERELAAGEAVGWAGEMSRGTQWAGCMVWLVAIPFTVFGLLWMLIAGLGMLADSGAMARVTSGLGALFGLPFLVIGLILLWQPMRMRRRARGTVYAVTDRRILRIVRAGATELSQVPLDRIASIDLQEYADGSGNLTVRTGPPRAGTGDDDIEATYLIVGIADARAAHRAIEERRRA